MKSMKTTSKWIPNSKYQSIIDNGRKHSIIVDLPEDKNGEDMAATALEVAFMSLAGCISTIYILVANKMRLKIEDLIVEMEAENPTGLEIESIKGIVKVKSADPKVKLEQCLQQTEEMCPVAKIFKHIPQDIKLEII